MLLTPLQQILYNRNIPIEKQKQWLNAGAAEIYGYSYLDKEKLNKALQWVWEAINTEAPVLVVVD